MRLGLAAVLRASVRRHRRVPQPGAQATNREHPQAGSCQTAKDDGGKRGVWFLARSKRGTRSMPAWLIVGTRQRRRRFCASGWEATLRRISSLSEFGGTTEFSRNSSALRGSYQVGRSITARCPERARGPRRTNDHDQSTEAHITGLHLFAWVSCLSWFPLPVSPSIDRVSSYSAR